MPTFKSLYRKRANTLYSCRRIALRASDTTLILVVPYPQRPKRTCLASMFCGFREFRTRVRNATNRNDAPQGRTGTMRRKIDRQATDEDGGRRDENRRACSIFLSISS